MKTLVIIPTYNEKENISAAVRGAVAADDGIDVLVVDDDSPDGTGRVAASLAAERPSRVSVLHRQRKSGLGSAYLAGFRIALERGYDLCCEMDADGSHDPADLSRLIAGAAQADLSIGSRRVEGGKVLGWGVHRRIMSAGAMSVARFALSLSTHDVTAGFRCYRRAVVAALLKLPLLSDGYAFQEETLFWCERLGFRVVEVPVIFRDRTKGESKLTMREAAAFFSTVARLRRFDASGFLSVRDVTGDSAKIVENTDGLVRGDGVGIGGDEGIERGSGTARL